MSLRWLKAYPLRPPKPPLCLIAAQLGLCIKAAQSAGSYPWMLKVMLLYKLLTMAQTFRELESSSRAYRPLRAHLRHDEPEIQPSVPGTLCG